MAKVNIKSEKLTPFGGIFSGHGAMFMNCPYEKGIILHHDHYLTIIIQMPISQI